MEELAVAGFAEARRRAFPAHGWLGLGLALVFWCVNWLLPGPRTHWAFFPLWLGYCLSIDGLLLWRTGTSLLTRSPVRYGGLFLLSAPAWWLFEALNLVTRNWTYIGAEHLGPLEFASWTTLNFTTVMPAVFGAAELAASLPWLRRLPRGPSLAATPRTTLAFFAAGWLGLLLLVLWPRVFFPLIWISPLMILEPINVWLGNRSLADWTGAGDWRPAVALWVGVLLTAFFWEMWNFHSFPKWIYSVPWGDALHVFEMPLLGYGGYLPFSLELFALYHFALGRRLGADPGFLRFAPD